ncbi:hypothetical protein PLEOSDRAFT_1048719 [Pleurotus ostreatus PC15]|uniref:T6SS Phospholipase effector Tle1-like catalytic domain-containing protein n=1 Tax=Pleurotus ostreatus (strain PC15) TaxID=1137138 RepID=A0A067NK87_PLEO1|nr:hypothetical protein PLEOSDRAFT_1048719 [Pleurotus ostreatus PC15]
MPGLLEPSVIREKSSETYYDESSLWETDHDLRHSIASSESFHLASKCECECFKSGRNVAVFIDGTANQFNEKNTNILELYAMVVRDIKFQATYYNSGIGTFAKPTWQSLKYLKQRFYHLVDTAIAWNFERIVLSAYQWLVENYQPGDCIFLFGFSRGAYQVRVIAGMIEKVGLLHKGNNDQIPFAFELYLATKKPSQTTMDEAVLNTEALCKQFKETLSQPDVKVHFIGAWDTVSSIGITRRPSFPETVNGMSHVCVFRHALALDECRVKFLPEYAGGGMGPSGKGNVKEVWFAGSHSDIGGGNTQNINMNAFGPSLRWMAHEAKEHGLKVREYRGNWSPKTSNNSLTGIWYLFELWPFRHLSYKDDTSTTMCPHFGAPRIIQPGQRIHHSVLIQLAKGYYPQAQLPGGLNWDYDLLVATANLTEDDPFASPSTIISKLKDSSLSGLDDSDISALSFLTSSGK